MKSISQVLLDSMLNPLICLISASFNGSMTTTRTATVLQRDAAIGKFC
jgi:hypothetical protein